MRIRNIKPEFFKDEKVCKMSHTERILFIGLMCMADKYGSLKNDSTAIAASIFPYDLFFRLEKTGDQIHSASQELLYSNPSTTLALSQHFARPTVALPQLLESLKKAGVIELYTDKDGTPAIHLKNFVKHQKLTKWEREKSSPSVHPPEGFRGKNESLSQHYPSTSLALSSEISEVSEEAEVSEGAEGRLPRLIIKFKNSHPACAHIPDMAIATILGQYPDADADEAIDAFSRDWIGNQFTGNQTPQTRLRAYLDRSQRARTGQTVTRAPQGREEPEDKDQALQKALLAKAERERVQKLAGEEAAKP